MGKTTIEVTEEARDVLKAERLDHESNYTQTILRLSESHRNTMVTEEQAREIANEQISERVVMEAQK